LAASVLWAEVPIGINATKANAAEKMQFFTGLFILVYSNSGYQLKSDCLIQPLKYHQGKYQPVSRWLRPAPPLRLQAAPARP
jgi:hypothetical protein